MGKLQNFVKYGKASDFSSRSARISSTWLVAPVSEQAIGRVICRPSLLVCLFRNSKGHDDCQLMHSGERRVQIAIIIFYVARNICDDM